MVGPWPLAPHHDPSQYIHHVHLMQRGQNQGITLKQRKKTTSKKEIYKNKTKCKI